jgi:hypothetical protein
LKRISSGYHFLLGVASQFFLLAESFILVAKKDGDDFFFVEALAETDHIEAHM